MHHTHMSKNILTILGFILFTTVVILIAAAVTQTAFPQIKSIEVNTFFKAAPTVFVIGRFGSHKLSKSDEGCLIAVGKLILFIAFFPFSLIFLILFGKKK